MNKFNYIIYHNNCIDGFTGLFLFLKTKLWTSDTIIYPDYPSAKNTPPNIDRKNVIIIDVAYKPEIIKNIASRAKRIMFIDHHKTIVDDIKDLNLSEPHEIVYDENECGASLVWKRFFNRSLPTFVKYVRDNDLGIWEYKETHDFISALEVNYKTDIDVENIKKWNNLLKDTTVKNLIDRGKVYNEYKQYLIEKNKPVFKRFPSKKYVDKKNKLLNKEGRYLVAVVPYGCPSPSLVGKYMMDTTEADFCVLWRYDIKKNMYILSFRSRDVDVGDIAKYFGGGGHKLASACSLPSGVSIRDIFVK